MDALGSLAGVRGVDELGAVEVVLAADGLPHRIRPLVGWTHAARAERARAAVGEAFAAAHCAEGTGQMFVRDPGAQRCSGTCGGVVSRRAAKLANDPARACYCSPRAWLPRLNVPSSSSGCSLNRCW